MLMRRIPAVVAISLGLCATTGAAQTPAAPPKYLGRIVGVYDDRSGNPLDSVEVTDVATKSSALTTSTGRCRSSSSIRPAAFYDFESWATNR